MRRYSDAETAYKKSIELDPRFEEVWNNLGNLEAKVPRSQIFKMTRHHVYHNVRSEKYHGIRKHEQDDDSEKEANP